MTAKISLEEAQRRLYEKHGNNITMSNYVAMNDYASFVCNMCGYEWKAEVGNVVNIGTGCENCYKIYKKENHLTNLSQEIVNDFIESQHCLWISGEYENNKSYLNIQFQCGCVGGITFGNFKNGRRCRFHQREKAAISRRTTLDEIIDDVEKHGFTFLEKIENNKIGRKIRIAYECNLGHRTERDYKDFYNHPTCEICKSTSRRISLSNTEKDIISIVESKTCSLIEIIFYNNEKDSLLTIEFSCGHRERMSLTNFRGRGTGLCNDCVIETVSGKNSYLWKGGLTPLTLYIRKNISDWNEESAKFYDYTCVITGKPMDHIHHLQSFNLILRETVEELNLEIKKNVSDYSSEELETILNKFLDIQDRYPFGVPISTSAHNFFHKIYGRGYNTPEQFYEFCDRIQSGNIQLPT
jgi:hypothetical protein